VNHLPIYPIPRRTNGPNQDQVISIPYTSPLRTKYSVLLFLSLSTSFIPWRRRVPDP